MKKENIIHVCPRCSGDTEEPCCRMYTCEAAYNEKGITSCIHCYCELTEVDGFWYHHTQFDDNGNLRPDSEVQDCVKFTEDYTLQAE